MTTATINTNVGVIEVELFDDDAPKTVENFRKLAADGFYDGIIFHRVIPDFMIQGGDPTGTGSGGPGYQFEDEENEHGVVRGVLAMANAGPNTNGSQFFIVTAEACPWLNGKHTVFGRVTTGMDVVDDDLECRDRPRRPPADPTSSWSRSSSHDGRERADARDRLPALQEDVHGDLIEGSAERYRGFKCPHCRLFVPAERTSSNYMQSRSACASGRLSSFLSVLFSIWRMRSRVTPNALPTSSSVHGWPPVRPKRSSIT